jgi:ribosomal protein S6--L-glutamate ligase
LRILILYGSEPSRNSLELFEAGQRLGHTVIQGTLSDISSEVSRSGSRFWLGKEEITDIEVVLLRSYGPGSVEQVTRRISLVEHMEFAGMRVVNPCYSFRRARDKYATQYYLQMAGLPVPTTFTTEGLAEGYRVCEEYKELIYKPILSSMGKGSIKFEDPDLAYNAFRMLSRYGMPLILQKYIPNPGRDIRVFVIGDQVVGSAYKYKAPGGWKTNVAQGGTMTNELVPDEILELGIKATKVLGLDYSGVDVIEGPDGPVILEANASPGWQALNQAADIKVADEIVKHAVKLANG